MSTATSNSPASATPFVTHCRDGYDKAHPALQAVYHRSWWGGITLIMGYTSLPHRIDIVCPNCEAVFHSITNRKELEKFRYRQPSPGEW